MSDNEIALLHEKIDHLTELLETQRKRQEAFDDFRRDVTPIVNQMVNLTIDELDEIGSDFELTDLLFLVKRLLRDTRLLIRALDRFEAIMDLADEADLLSKQVFNNVIEALDRLERKGYFSFVRNGMMVVDRVVEEFGEDDIRALGDNIVTILKTVRNMTQPEIMALANNAINAIRDERPVEATPSALDLLRELGDPQVRRGLARMLNMVKSLAEDSHPTPTTQS